MQFTSLLLVLPWISLGAAETVLGAYIFHRHGDRTTKSYTPVSLTPLGAQQVYSSGAWYRGRYVSNNASAKINGISPDIVQLSQLSVTSPVDNVLQNSAQVFLQSLYPPAKASSEQLPNGKVVEGPLGGYQYIPVNADMTSASSKNVEENGWLQGGSGCPKAVASSNDYFKSTQHLDRLAETLDFYQELLPVYENTFSGENANFKNAYTIFDFINVATIHNDTSEIPSSNLVTPETLNQLHTLASEHEWGLAYNSSEPIRAVSGSVLAGHIVQELNTTLHSPLSKSSARRLSVQFGAYGTFMSFFGLSRATAASPDFYGIVNYASSFVIELVTDVDISSSSTPRIVSPDDVSIRFLFANGTASDTNPPKAFALFGQEKITIKWNTFVSEMNKFSLKSTAEWCGACGATEGVCAEFSGGNGSGVTAAESKGTGGISKVAAGVIGAMVTLAVILGLQALVLAAGGLRVVRKKTLVLALAPKMSRDDASSMEHAYSSK